MTPIHYITKMFHLPPFDTSQSSLFISVSEIWITSSSLLSKGLSRCCGMSSLKPFCRARNWASMPRMNLQLTYSLTETQSIIRDLQRNTENTEASAPHSPPLTTSDSFLFGNDSHTINTCTTIDILLTFLSGILYVQGSLNQIDSGKSSKALKTYAKPN